MKNRLSICFLVLVGLMICIPMLCTNIKRNQESYFDNRYLVEFPKLGTPGYSGQVEAYVNDRIGFRRDFITAYQTACYHTFGVLVHPGFIAGQNGYFYDNWNLKTYQHLEVDEEYVDLFAKYIFKLEDEASKQQAKFLFFIAPDKETVYPEYFPAGYNVANRENRTDLILKALNEEGITTVFPKEELCQQKLTTQVYNVKDDPGHWNAVGAYYGNRCAMQVIHKWFPEYTVLGNPCFEEGVAVHLDGTKMRINETVPILKVNGLQDNAEDYFQQHGIKIPEMQYKHYDATKDTAPSILLIGDSYYQGYGVAESFAMTGAEVTFLTASVLPDYQYYLETIQPDVVLVETAERRIEGDWWSIDSIKNQLQ